MPAKSLVPDRRHFLKAGAAGTAGASLYLTTGCKQASSPKTNTAHDTTAQPAETGWKAKTPPLKTPWTDEVSSTAPRPEYPRPQLKRAAWANLNGVWQFAAAKEGDAVPVGKDLPERILVPYPVESALSGVMRHEDRMVYRRRFAVPESWQIGTANRLLINFDAVDQSARVWVNGKQVGTHDGGYDRFTVDATDALTRDALGKPTGPQELIVTASDPTEKGQRPVGKQHVDAIDNPDSALYYMPSSGIWQTVWMEPAPAAHIERLELTPNLATSALDVTVHPAAGRGQRVEVAAFDGDRQVAKATGTAGAAFALKLDNPKLWSPETPFLYRLTTRLIDGDAADEVESYFGMRSIGIAVIDGHPRIVLNGKRAFPLSNLQQGFWPDGIYTAATDAALKFDLEQSKRLGFNTARKHQKVEPDRWYYHADTLGIMVWQDMPATPIGRQPPHQREPSPPPPAAAATAFEAELRRMVDQLRNHPSVIIWTPFNEGWGEYDGGRIAAMVKGWDPSRLVDEMSGINVCDCAGDSGDFVDMHNLGKVWPGPAPQAIGKRVAAIGEFGALALAIPGHVWDPAHAHPNVLTQSVDDMTKKYVYNMQQITDFIVKDGLAAASYNLFEDVEHQVNGLFTYDRALLKPDAGQIRAANARVLDAGYGRATPTPAATQES